MCYFNKILIVALLAGISCIHAAENLISVVSKPNELVEFIQLKSEPNKLEDSRYTYKCTVGSTKIGRVGCSTNVRSSWKTPHDVELTLRCPKSGTVSTITYAEILFTVTSQNVNCVVIGGGVGHNFILMKVNSWGTKLLDYKAYFYVH